MNDLYEILKDKPNITEQEFKTIYLNLIKKYHPDFNRENEKECTLITKKINNQYSEILKSRKFPSKKNNDFKEDFENIKYSSKTAEKKNNITKPKFRDISFSTKYNAKTYTAEKNSSNLMQKLSLSKNKFIVLENNKKGYLFIYKDYAIKKFGDERVEQRKIMYINKADKNQLISIHNIYGTIDFEKIKTDTKYMNYLANILLTNEKLKSISENLYGYIGDTIKKDENYQQQCNVNILQALREQSNKNKLYFKRVNNSKFTLNKVYEEYIDQEKRDVYKYENYSDNLKITDNEIIKTNINMDRMEVNKKYRNMVLEQYCNNDWIKKCSKDKNGYIGNPELDYKNSLKNEDREL